MVTRDETPAVTASFDAARCHTVPGALMADAAGVERGVRMRAINAATTVTTPGSLAWSPPA